MPAAIRLITVLLCLDNCTARGHCCHAGLSIGGPTLASCVEKALSNLEVATELAVERLHFYFLVASSNSQQAFARARKIRPYTGQTTFKINGVCAPAPNQLEFEF